MTADRPTLTRPELADLLTDAAQCVSGILTAAYPTAASRSYLHPVLGALSAGPQVVGKLNERLEWFVAAEHPATPAGLFTLASYASALGWLTESLAELTTSVERICTHVGIPAELPTPVVAATGDAEGGDDFDFAFSALEMAAIRTAAEAAGLPQDDYVTVLSESLVAASRITDALMEISSGLREDAAYVVDEATDHVGLGDGPNSLPTLIRSLLTHLETTG
ncbi:hypothetical protein [Streptomyces sp. NPDC048410]|uniref:hypothetical protein n=1 Tax=Streptomyces sp. NPDC048410 TaxID=3365545 RepID=UPI00370F830C